ncbi:hypothetical protein [Actinokineospora enzanensis]|uniref:hypothetical protein n=1 Tax=Actinokineospora enzanensis TaxID=155975 RepID=UPI0003775B07|nr:hypothetical protein [Actinokineospora enzanensis]
MPNRFSQDVVDTLQTPANVHTEDESARMLEGLEKYIQQMGPAKLGFLYQMWRDHPACLPANKGRWTEKVAGEGDQEKTDPGGGLYQLKVINWGFLWGARGRLDNLAAAAGKIDGAASAVSGKLQGGWTSKAGEAAVTKINDLRGTSQDYATAVGQLRDHIGGAWQATREAVQKLSQFADRSDVGGKSMTDRFGKYADGLNGFPINRSERDNYMIYMGEMNDAIKNGVYRGGWNDKEVSSTGGDITQFAFSPAGGLFTSVTPSNPQELHTPGAVKLTEGDNRWSNEICNELNDYCECYHLTMQNLRKQIDETVRTVKSAWDELRSATITLSTDPFAKLSLASANPPPPEEKGDDHPGKDQPGDGHQGQDNPGTGTGNPGTGNTGTGMPTQPANVEPPKMPEPGATDPSSVPGTPQPPTPQPPSLSAPETVTIQDGDRTIGVQSPDGQGHVKVTVDDGSGKPKTYDLDFSAGSGGVGPDGKPVVGADGQPVVGPDGKPVTDGHAGSAGQPVGGSQAIGADGKPVAGAQTVLGPDGQPIVVGPDGQPVIGPDGKPVTGSFGPEGSTQSDPSVQHVQAGADGKAVIHDGDLTITAERPADSPDSVRITVDDGTGHPVTYTVDADDSPAQAQGATSRVDGGPADPRAGVHGGPGSADGSTSGVPGTHSANGPVSGDGSATAVSGGHGSGGSVMGGPGADGAGSAAAMSGNADAGSRDAFAHQSTFAASDGGGSWGAAGSVFDDPTGDALRQDHPGDHSNGHDSHGGHDNGDTQASGAGEASLASAQVGGHDQASGQAGSAMGGMPMGAMGGGGAGGGGGDAERGGSQWRTSGQLFDDDYAEAEARIAGSLDGNR